MSNIPERRAEDPRLIRIEQKLDAAHDATLRVKNDLDVSKAELKSWQQLHEEWCKVEIKRIDDALKPLKEAFEIVDKPARYLGRTIVVVATGGLLFAGEKFMAWFARHFN